MSKLETTTLQETPKPLAASRKNPRVDPVPRPTNLKGPRLESSSKTPKAASLDGSQDTLDPVDVLKTKTFKQGGLQRKQRGHVKTTKTIQRQ